MQQTHKQLIDALPEPYRSRILAQVEKERGDNTAEFLATHKENHARRLIAYAVTWTGCKEGQPYWKALYHTLAANTPPNQLHAAHLAALEATTHNTPADVMQELREYAQASVAPEVAAVPAPITPAPNVEPLVRTPAGSWVLLSTVGMVKWYGSAIGGRTCYVVLYGPHQKAGYVAEWEEPSEEKAREQADHWAVEVNKARATYGAR